MSTQHRLADKIAIVTGGSSGIGAETARQFARHGADVMLCDVDDGAGASVVAEILADGGRAAYHHLDVTDEAAWEAVVEAVMQRHGRLDVLANIAGVSGRPPGTPVTGEGRAVGPRFADQTLTDWHRVMDVNATGTFLGTRIAARAMAEGNGGSIVNISSICGIVGSFSSPAYHASKGAVRLLSKSAAIQCAPDRVRVNSIHPGFVDTPMTEAAHASNAVARQRLEATPLGRFGTPHDIAMGCVYLASDESAWVTGTELVIDGGMVAN